MSDATSTTTSAAKGTTGNTNHRLYVPSCPSYTGYPVRCKYNGKKGNPTFTTAPSNGTAVKRGTDKKRLRLSPGQEQTKSRRSTKGIT